MMTLLSGCGADQWEYGYRVSGVILLRGRST
jgi:hypothetical protein